MIEERKDERRSIAESVRETPSEIEEAIDRRLVPPSRLTSEQVVDFRYRKRRPADREVESLCDLDVRFPAKDNVIARIIDATTTFSREGDETMTVIAGVGFAVDKAELFEAAEHFADRGGGKAEHAAQIELSPRQVVIVEQRKEHVEARRSELEPRGDRSTENEIL